MTIEIREQVKLAPYTSWLVGGPAEFLAEPRSIEEARESLQWADQRKLPVTVLSGGTNVLVSDKGIRGLVLAMKRLVGVSIEERQGRIHLDCLSGTSKSELLKIFLKHRLAPALFLAGLPGDVGGGVAMNAGIGEMLVPREFVEITDWIDVLRGPEAQYKVERIEASKLRWSYRHCEGWKPGVIVRAGLSWANEPQADILQRVKQANQVRLSKQPLDMPSCGSVFVNPANHKSGQLIESSQLKGFKIGCAQVSPKHANFIVNTGGATATDIHQVIRHVQATVKEQTGVELKTEVVYLGEW